MTDPTVNPQEVLSPTRYTTEALDFLAEEGFRPQVDEDGDVYFKFEGGTYVLVTTEEDRTYFALYYLRFWPLDDAAERVRAHEAAAEAHRRIRVGRVTVLEDNVSASIQAYLPDGDGWRGVLLRNLSGLQALVKTFCEQMRAQLEN